MPDEQSGTLRAVVGVLLKDLVDVQMSVLG